MSINGAHPRISIVVSTNGKARSLRRTLDSFRRLAYPEFEVCVVIGPTEDGSREIVREYADRGDVKFAACPELNLAMSRNMGVRIASGEIVAFIDDDAVPEPEWLSQLAPAFADPGIGGAGGVTHDHTGYTYQARFILCDRFGGAQFFQADPGVADFCFPFSRRYPSLMGVNCAFRRSVLVEIGGFDEEFEYYLYETDICSRIIDHGYQIVELANAAVHHTWPRNHPRTDRGLLTPSFPVLKNKVYFAIANSPVHHRIDEAIENIQAFFALRRDDIVRKIEHGRLPAETLLQFDEEAERAWRIGLARGMEGRRRTQPKEWFRRGSPFRPFSTLNPEGGRRTFVFLSRTYPPANMTGNARHTSDIAHAIASQGHNVHVLTAGREFNRVDLEDGVWVHRIVARPHKPRQLPGGQTIPEPIWNHSATMLDEARRISRSRRVDVVEGVSWDCETAAFVLDGRFPVATNIVTSLAHWLETHPEQASDRRWMSEFGRPMLALERIIYDGSDRNIAASEAIVDSLRERYGASFDAVARCAHGLEDMRPLAAARPAGLDEAAAGRTKVLFVGRLELRKGIDTLLQAAARLLDDKRDVEFWIAGDNSLDIGGGSTAQQAFLAIATGETVQDRVRFFGPVDDAELRWLYAHCDLFVAPSLFESFGLVFVEAMMYGKPVIACRAGAASEVVADGETGLLTPPSDATALADAIAALAEEPALRERLGKAGRVLYERRFTAAVVAGHRIEALLQLARSPVPRDRVRTDGGARTVSTDTYETGLLLGRRGRVAYLGVSGELFLTFLRHDRGGVAAIHLNGALQAEHDLYSPKQLFLTVRVSTAGPGDLIEVTPGQHRNPRANASEVVVVAAEER